MQHALIVGTDFLNTVELNMKQGNISIRKINTNDNQIPDVFRIEVEDEIDGLDLSRVSDPKHKQTMKKLVQHYESIGLLGK